MVQHFFLAESLAGLCKRNNSSIQAVIDGNLLAWETAMNFNFSHSWSSHWRHWKLLLHYISVCPRLKHGMSSYHVKLNLVKPGNISLRASPFLHTSKYVPTYKCKRYCMNRLLPLIDKDVLQQASKKLKKELILCGSLSTLHLSLPSRFVIVPQNLNIS